VLATNDRAVTSTDYETFAEKVSGVARALAQTVDDDETIPENTVLVQIVPVGSGAPTQDLLDEVEALLLSKKTNTTRLMVVPALYVDVRLVGTVFLKKGRQALLPAAIEAEADAILRSKQTVATSGGSAGVLDLYLDAQNIDTEAGEHTVGFGSRVPLSDLLGEVRDSGTLRKYIDQTYPTGDLVLAAKRFPRLAAYTKAVLTGPDRVEFTWTDTSTKLVVREEP
jgi:hypothetical protein